MAVFALDLIWSLVSSSTAPTEFALVDEPVHLATTLVFLIALVTLVESRRPAPAFIAAAVVAGVAIDLDHLPGLLGWNGLTAGVPRPYTHSLVTPLVLIAVGALVGGRARPIAFGAAFGVGAHLFRDLCTGPGLALAWPVSSEVVRLSYAVFATGLIAAAAAVVAAGRRGRAPASRVGAPRRTRRPSRLLPGLLALAVGVVVAVAPDHAQASPTAFGVYLPGADQRPSLLDSFGARVGREPAIVSSYKRWRLPPFPRGELQAAWGRGAVPLVTWEPWTADARGFSLRRIADGAYDDYARRAARSAAAWGHPILLRFAHEMNGTWYPWGRGMDGSTPAVYRAAWRHLVQIFRSAGATNVRWVWTPNVDGGGQYPFRAYYPGDRWVDWVGLDGFNWARRGEWESFTDLFGASYDTLSHLTSRPMIIAETGSSQSGGDKAQWVASALGSEIPGFARVRAVVWFSDRVGDVDFRIDSSRSSLKAFRSGIATRRYGLGRSALLKTPAEVRGPSSAPPAPSGGFGQPSLAYRLTQKLHGRYLFVAIGLGAAAIALGALVIVHLRRRRRARMTPSEPSNPGRRTGGPEPQK